MLKIGGEKMKCYDNNDNNGVVNTRPTVALTKLNAEDAAIHVAKDAEDRLDLRVLLDLLDRPELTGTLTGVLTG